MLVALTLPVVLRFKFLETLLWLVMVFSEQSSCLNHSCCTCPQVMIVYGWNHAKICFKNTEKFWPHSKTMALCDKHSVY